MADALTFTGPTRTNPRWCARFLSPDYLLRTPAKVDASQFLATDGVRVTVGAAGAAGGATSVPVAALTGPIPSGTTVYLGTNKYLTLTVAAVTGAVTLTVAALPTALVSGDTGTYAGTGKKSIPSGTYLGRTFAERDAGTGYGPALATDDERFLSAWPIDDAAKNPDVELVKHRTEVRTNFLPGYSALAGAVSTQLRLDYVAITGAE